VLEAELLPELHPDLVPALPNLYGDDLARHLVVVVLLLLLRRRRRRRRVVVPGLGLLPRGRRREAGGEEGEGSAGGGAGGDGLGFCGLLRLGARG
jgi:hypothetical protein